MVFKKGCIESVGAAGDAFGVVAATETVSGARGFSCSAFTSEVFFEAVLCVEFCAETGVAIRKNAVNKAAIRQAAVWATRHFRVLMQGLLFETKSFLIV
jgi:hypothetical protein